MPARKPDALLVSKVSKENKKKRKESEKLMKPSFPINQSVPAILRGKKIAEETWIKTISLYDSAKGELVTAFDENILTTFCLLEEQIRWLDIQAENIKKSIDVVEKIILKKPAPKSEKSVIKEYYNLVKQYNYLISRLQGIDARCDGKRKLLHQISQSLYLTPRSRAGVSPTIKNK